MYYNREFLKQLDEHRTKVVYARIIALSLDETPIEAIEGRVTQGSVNIDGDSAVRRTCSLTIAAQNFDYNAFLWGLNTKFKLEIGLENVINNIYPDIIWFKQGTYFISSFSTSHSTNNFNISIQGKDKMCALNGELGGALTSSADFGTIEEISTIGGKQTTQITKLTVKEIIRNVVHLYGGEPLHNIIINDLDMAGLELLEYRYDETRPMYLYRDAEEHSAFINITTDGKIVCSIEGGETEITLDQLTSNELDQLVNPMTGNRAPAKILIDGTYYYIAKVSYGDTAGYRFTDLTYPGDLIGNVGETITSILDKIKNMLGDFEYFYDLDGRFIFQRKKYAFESSWSPIGSDEEQNEIVDFDNNIAYTFSDSALITAFNNNPDLTNLKNDYSVWGARQSLSGVSIPVHMRYAIDKKPIYYKNLAGVEFTSAMYDWRELIYQMAKDYYKNTNNDEFSAQLAAANQEYYPSGKTGYESYYTDVIGFWRDIYNPDSHMEKAILSQQRDQLIADRDNIKDIMSDEYKTLTSEIETLDANITSIEQTINNELSKTNYIDGQYKYWSKTVYEAPQNLNFWFDFLDTEGALSQYSVRNIGCRPKAINDINIKAIYFRETPDVIFTTDYEKDSAESTAYSYISIPETEVNTMFSISAQGKSAKAEIDDLLYRHSYCIASATITTIPIYYLEPNTKIHLVDRDSNLDGYYNISKLSIPLTYNGTMSITATKAAENI